MVFSSGKSKKQNIPMVCLSVSSGILLRKLQEVKELPVQYFFSFLNPVSITLFIVWVLLLQEQAARQLVSHRHITVNGTVVNIPSFQLKPGDIIGVREKSKSLESIVDSLTTKKYSKLSWLEWDDTQMAGKFMNVPERTDIPENIKEQLIVELYSK